MSRHYSSRSYGGYGSSRRRTGADRRRHPVGRDAAPFNRIDVRAVGTDADTVARSERGAIRVLSEGYPLCEVSLSELEAVPAEAGTTKALIRGIAARFAALGHAPVAFDAYVLSLIHI